MPALKRNVVVSYLAGVLFSVGWWMLFDANAQSNLRNFEDGKVTGVQYVPGIFATLAMIMYPLWLRYFETQHLG